MIALPLPPVQKPATMLSHLFSFLRWSQYTTGTMNTVGRRIFPCTWQHSGNLLSMANTWFAFPRWLQDSGSPLADALPPATHKWSDER